MGDFMSKAGARKNTKSSFSDFAQMKRHLKEQYYY